LNLRPCGSFDGKQTIFLFAEKGGGRFVQNFREIANIFAKILANIFAKLFAKKFAKNVEILT
jgi:hypothetical protein